MARYVLSACRTQDLYLLFCDSTNRFTAIGTRAEIAALLAADGAHPEAVRQRLDRASLRGTSALFGGHPERPFGGWDTGYLPLHAHLDTEGSWRLRRDRLAAYALALLAHEDDLAASLLEPAPTRHDSPRPVTGEKPTRGTADVRPAS